MNPDTGRFENLHAMSVEEKEARMVELRAAVIRVNPQYDPGKRQDPCLCIGEVIEIKGVAFRVLRIKADGKLGLQMLVGGSDGQQGIEALPVLRKR